MSKTQEQLQLKVTQEKLPGSQLGLEVEISPERSREAYEQTIKNFMRSAQIPGFRRGKVPRQIVMQRFGAMQLKAATLEDLVEKTFKQVLEQEKIDALGNFQLRSSFDELVSQFEPGYPITYSASIDVPPEATLKRYTQFQVQAEEGKYDPTQVDRVIDEQRSTRSTLVPIEGRAAEWGDVAVVDFSGQFYVDETKTITEPIEGGSAEDFQVELQEERFIPGFIEGIIGMNPDETKDLEVQFPEDYLQEDLAGKTALFNITLKDLKTKELPELNDSLAQEISEFETLAALREFLEERYQKEAQDKTDANVKTALLDALVQELEVELPETMVANEVSFLINRMAQRMQEQGVDVNQLFTKDTIPALKERFRDEATVRVKRTLALGKVAEQESISVDTEALEKRFQEIASQVSDLKIDRDRLREVLEEEILQENIIDWLKEHSEVTLVEKLEETPEEIDAPQEDAPAIAASTSAVPEALATPKATTKKTKAKSVDPEPPASEQSIDIVAEPVDAEQPSEEKPVEKAKTGRRSRTTKTAFEKSDQS